ncbi:MAG: hypothetical protein J6U04_02680 [Salinivirgaceae bacterium]|nr:hypothetical protein [Salinivirgaceae bacterium]
MSLETVYLGRGIAKLFVKIIYPWMRRLNMLKVWIIWMAVSVLVWGFCYYVIGPNNPQEQYGGLRDWQKVIILDVLVNVVFNYFMLLYIIVYFRKKHEEDGCNAVVEPASTEKKTLWIVTAVVVVLAEVVFFATYAFIEPVATLINISTATKFWVFLISSVVLAVPSISALRAYYTPVRPKGIGAYYFLIIMLCVNAGMFNSSLVFPNFIESQNAPKTFAVEQITDVDILQAKITASKSSGHKTNNIELIFNNTYYSIDVVDSVIKMLPNGSAVSYGADVAIHTKSSYWQKFFAGKAQMRYVMGRMGHPCVVGFIAADSANTLPPDRTINEWEKRQEETKNTMLEIFMNSAPKNDSVTDNQ